jgi:hypothetical protein
MLKLNTDEIRNLQFEVSIQGINYDELQGSLKFIIEDVEYGIPVKIQRDLVSVEVPPLEEIVARGMKNGDIVECKLDIFGNGFYINPWGGQFELSTPVKMETKNFNMNNKQPDKKIVAELKDPTTTLSEPIVEDSKPKEILDKEAILEMLFEKLEERGFKTDGHKIPEAIKETIEQPKENKLSRKELVEQKIRSKFKRVNSLVKEVKSLTEGKKVISSIQTPATEIVRNTNIINTDMSSVMQKVEELKSRTSSTVAQPILPTQLNNPIQSDQSIEHEITIDYEDPHVLMESVGMKNPKIQQIMLDKAIELGGDGDSAISQTLKKLLGIEKPQGYEAYQNQNFN